MIVELKTERLRTGDIIRTFDGKLGMVINIEDMTPVIIYKCGFDFVSDLIKCTDIQMVARPNQEYMLAFNNWEHAKLWDNPENIIYKSDIRFMTRQELEDNDEIHARLGYTLRVKE